MLRQLVIPDPIRAKIRACGLNRHILVSLLNDFYIGFPERYNHSKKRRALGLADSCYREFVKLSEDTCQHLFVVLVDDATSPDHLFIHQLTHLKNEKR